MSTRSTIYLSENSRLHIYREWLEDGAVMLEYSNEEFSVCFALPDDLAAIFLDMQAKKYAEAATCAKAK